MLRPSSRLRHRNALPDMPQAAWACCQILCYHCVGRAALFHVLSSSSRSNWVAGMAFGFMVRRFQARHKTACLRHRYSGTCCAGESACATRLSANWPITSKPVKPALRCLVRQAQQGYGRLHRWHRRPGGELAPPACGYSFIARSGDDAQCALAANHQIAQVVPGVVLAQARS